MPVIGNLIVFDLDGVLIDSRWANYEAFRHGLAAVGCGDPGEPRVTGLIGLPAREMLVRLGCPESEAERVYEHFVKPHYIDNISQLARPMEGAGAALELLRGLGFRLAACTSGDAPTQRRALEATGLLEYLEQLQTPCRSSYRKPDPRYLQEVVDHFETDGPVLHIEDTEMGVKMGLAQGAVTVFAEYGFGRLDTTLADHHLNRIGELPPLARHLRQA